MSLHTHCCIIILTQKALEIAKKFQLSEFDPLVLFVEQYKTSYVNRWNLSVSDSFKFMTTYMADMPIDGVTDEEYYPSLFFLLATIYK